MFTDLGKLISENDYEIKKELINKSQDELEYQAKVISYLKSGYKYSTVSSIKFCEFCDEIAGSFVYFTDGIWVWANWLIHYVEKHKILLPDAFKKTMEENTFTIDVHLVKRKVEKFLST